MTRSSIGGKQIRYAQTCSVFTIQSASFRSGFDTLSDSAISNLNYYASNYLRKSISWVGHVGTGRGGCCGGSVGPSWHYHYRAWDIDRIQWSDSSFLDICNHAHASSSRKTRRQYIAVDAILRRYYGTVLDGWYDSKHVNHFHVDSGCTVGPLSKTKKSHTVFIQAAANNLIGTNLTIDGVWGPLTQNAYQAMLVSLCMTCLNPLSNTSHFLTFLAYIAMHGFKDQALGYYKYSCTPCAV
ncbi:MAG TPA: hypothetical protein VF246_02750 [Acidimicrobiia bacterium]